MKPMLLLTAPDVPSSEIKKLKKRIKKALKNKADFILVNYEVFVTEIKVSSHK